MKKQIKEIFNNYLKQNGQTAVTEEILNEGLPLGVIAWKAVLIYSEFMLFDEAVDIVGINASKLLHKIGIGKGKYNPQWSSINYDPEGENKGSADYFEKPPVIGPGMMTRVGWLTMNFVAVAQGGQSGYTPSEYVKELNKFWVFPSPEQERSGIFNGWTRAEVIRDKFYHQWKDQELAKGEEEYLKNAPRVSRRYDDPTGRTPITLGTHPEPMPKDTELKIKKAANDHAQRVWMHWIGDPKGSRHPWIRFEYFNGDIANGKLVINQKGLAYTIIRRMMFHLFRGSTNDASTFDEKSKNRYANGRTIESRYKASTLADLNTKFPNGPASIYDTALNLGLLEKQAINSLFKFAENYPWVEWKPRSGSLKNKPTFYKIFLNQKNNEDLKNGSWVESKSNPFSLFPDEGMGKTNDSIIAGKNLKKEFELLFKGANFDEEHGYNVSPDKFDENHVWSETVEEYWDLVEKRIGRLPPTLSRSLSGGSVGVTGSPKAEYAWTRDINNQSSFIDFIYGDRSSKCKKSFNERGGKVCSIIQYLMLIDEKVQIQECELWSSNQDSYGVDGRCPKRPGGSKSGGVEMTKDGGFTDALDAKNSSKTSVVKPGVAIAKMENQVALRNQSGLVAAAFRAYVPFQDPDKFGTWTFKRPIPKDNYNKADFGSFGPGVGVDPRAKNLVRNPRRQKRDRELTRIMKQNEKPAKPRKRTNIGIGQQPYPVQREPTNKGKKYIREMTSSEAGRIIQGYEDLIGQENFNLIEKIYNSINAIDPKAMREPVEVDGQTLAPIPLYTPGQIDYLESYKKKLKLSMKDPNSKTEKETKLLSLIDEVKKVRNSLKTPLTRILKTIQANLQVFPDPRLEKEDEDNSNLVGEQTNQPKQPKLSFKSLGLNPGGSGTKSLRKFQPKNAKKRAKTSNDEDKKVKTNTPKNPTIYDKLGKTIDSNKWLKTQKNKIAFISGPAFEQLGTTRMVWLVQKLVEKKFVTKKENNRYNPQDIIIGIMRLTRQLIDTVESGENVSIKTSLKRLKNDKPYYYTINTHTLWKNQKKFFEWDSKEYEAKYTQMGNEFKFAEDEKQALKKKFPIPTKVLVNAGKANAEYLDVKIQSVSHMTGTPPRKATQIAATVTSTVSQKSFTLYYSGEDPTRQTKFLDAVRLAAKKFEAGKTGLEKLKAPPHPAPIPKVTPPPRLKTGDKLGPQDSKEKAAEDANNAADAKATTDKKTSDPAVATTSSKIKAVPSDFLSRPVSQKLISLMNAGKEQKYSLRKLKIVQAKLIRDHRLPKLNVIQGNLLRYFKNAGKSTETFANAKLSEERTKEKRILGDNDYGKETRDAIMAFQEALIARGFLAPQKSSKEFKGYTNKDGLYGPNTHKMWIKATKHGLYDENNLKNLSEDRKNTLIGRLNALSKQSGQDEKTKTNVAWANWMLSQLRGEETEQKKTKDDGKKRPATENEAAKVVKKAEKALKTGKISDEKSPGKKCVPGCDIGWKKYIEIQHAASNLAIDTLNGRTVTYRDPCGPIKAYCAKLAAEKEKPLKIELKGRLADWTRSSETTKTNLGFEVAKWTSPPELGSKSIYIATDKLSPQALTAVKPPVKKGMPWKPIHLPIYNEKGEGIGWLINGKFGFFGQQVINLGKAPEPAQFEPIKPKIAKKVKENNRIFENYFRKNERR